MVSIRRPVLADESLSHVERTSARAVHKRQKFYVLSMSADAKNLLETMIAFIDIVTFEANLLSLILYTADIDDVESCIVEILALPGVCVRKDYATFCFNEDALGKIGVKVVDRHRLNQEMQQRGLTGEDAEIYNAAIDVMKAYNRVRGDFYGRRESGFVPQPIRFTGATQTAAKAVAKFCKHHRIDDYELYFFVLCHARKWASLPYLNYCHHPSCYDTWEACREDVVLLLKEKEWVDARKEREQEDRDAGKKISIFRDIHRGMETIKHGYKRSGSIDLCLQSFWETGGYHPKSKVCQTCMASVECTQKLVEDISELTKGHMDIIALREGRQDIVQLQAALKAAGVGLDVYDGTTTSARSRIKRALGV